MAVIVKLASSFTVPAAADKVVALFLDPATMRSCIPGCEELVQTDETHYKGTLVNEVAHVRFKAGFTARSSPSLTPRVSTDRPSCTPCCAARTVASAAPSAWTRRCG